MRPWRRRVQPPDGGVLRRLPVASLLRHHEDMRRGLSSVVQVVRRGDGARSAAKQCDTSVSLLPGTDGQASILLPLI